jgi:mannose/fructose/N-acetylgalactosamine-specific phosphotransferase system component IIB
MSTNQAPIPPQAPENYATSANNNYQTHPQETSQFSIEIVGRVNFPSTQLFEATGFVDTKKQFPTANAFLMFVPGVPDQSKQSGRTYNQAGKEVMKISVRDLFALADAIHFAATYGQCDFMIFTDSAKFEGTAQGQGQKKQVSVGTAIGKNGKPKIFLNYNGSKKITIAMEKWHAVGLALQLKVLAEDTLRSKFEHERAMVKK